MKKANATILLVSFLLIPSNAFADGGLPLIYVLNTYSFIVGAIFVFLIEYLYIKKLFKNTDPKQIAVCVLKFNTVSTLFGVIIVPLVLIIVQLEPIFYAILQDTKESTMILVWVLSLSIDFVLAFTSTIFIEYKMLKRAYFASELYEKKSLLKHVVMFNTFSYLFLILLVVITLAVMNLWQ